MSVEGRGDWKSAAENVNFHPDGNKQDKPNIVRDTAIEQATSEELTEAIDRMGAKLDENPANKAEILTALAQARARLDRLIQGNEH